MAHGFAMFAATAPEAIRAAAREAEALGYGSFWVNHPGSTDGLASLAQAAGEGALWNVQINLKSLPEGADKQGVESDLHRLAATLRRASEDCRTAVTSTLNAS